MAAGQMIRYPIPACEHSADTAAVAETTLGRVAVLPARPWPAAGDVDSDARQVVQPAPRP